VLHDIAQQPMEKLTLNNMQKNQSKDFQHLNTLEANIFP